jgi:hypothetical protein
LSAERLAERMRDEDEDDGGGKNQLERDGTRTTERVMARMAEAMARMIRQLARRDVTLSRDQLAPAPCLLIC